MQTSKANEKEVKNLLNVLENMSAPNRTARDIEQAVEYAKTWAKAQIQYYSINSDENDENQPPTETRTSRRLFKSRIPTKSCHVEDNSNFQRSSSLKHRSSTPNINKAPRSSSTGRISNGATSRLIPPKPKREIGILEATSPPNSPFFEKPKSKVSSIEQSPFLRYKSKSVRNKPSDLMKLSLVSSTPSNSGSDYEFNRSYSLSSGILKSGRRGTSKSSNKRKSVTFVSASEEDSTSSDVICVRKPKTGRRAAFTHELKNIIADVKNFSLSKIFK